MENTESGIHQPFHVLAASEGHENQYRHGRRLLDDPSIERGEKAARRTTT